MIRFIDLTDQIVEDEYRFAWFDTVTDTFVEIGENYVWDTLWGFINDYHNDKAYSKPTLERFLGLYPKSEPRVYSDIRVPFSTVLEGGAAKTVEAA